MQNAAHPGGGHTPAGSSPPAPPSPHNPNQHSPAITPDPHRHPLIPCGGGDTPVMFGRGAAGRIRTARADAGPLRIHLIPRTADHEIDLPRIGEIIGSHMCGPALGGGRTPAATRLMCSPPLRVDHRPSHGPSRPGALDRLHDSRVTPARAMVGPVGLEPTTRGLKVASPPNQGTTPAYRRGSVGTSEAPEDARRHLWMDSKVDTMSTVDGPVASILGTHTDQESLRPWYCTPAVRFGHTNACTARLAYCAPPL